MKSSESLAVAVATLFVAVAAHAAHVDMTDPKRAVGREDDVRVDAQLVKDTISSGSPVGVTYQIENLSNHAIAVADKICDISYDKESRTVTVSLGSEVPARGEMPHVILIAPGEKRTLSGGAILHVATPNVRSPFVAIPQFVEIRVNVLRDVESLHDLIAQRDRATAPITLSDQQFDHWIESNDTIFLNAIPVHYLTPPRGNQPDASEGAGRGTF